MPLEEGSHQVSMDSLSYDLLKYNFLAFHEVKDSNPVIDIVFPGDSVLVMERNLVMFDSREMERENITAEIGSLLIVKECDSVVCELTIHKGDARITDGFLPYKATARLTNPHMEDQMKRFYIEHGKLIEKYSKLIRRRYNLSKNDFDSLLQNEIDKVREKEFSK